MENTSVQINCRRCKNYDCGKCLVNEDKELINIKPDLNCFEENILYINNDGTYSDPINTMVNYKDAGRSKRYSEDERYGC